MRFDFIDYVSFDICILGRQEAAEDFPTHVGDAIARRFAEMDEAARKALSVNVAGSGIATVLPSRRSAFPLLGLSRIMSTETDYQTALDAVDLTADGVTLCTGSFGARADNDLPAMMQRLGPRAHFLHLRNVRREGSDLRGSFDVAEHLGGNTDMVGVITAIIAEERRRRTEGRPDWNIPFRPDRGQDILDFLLCKRPTGISCHRAAQRLVGIARDQDNVGSSVGHRCKSSGKSLVSIVQLRLWPTLSGPL